MKNLNLIKQLYNSISNISYFVRCNRVSTTAVLVGLIGLSDLAVGREQHDAHTHGVANMTLVSENGVLEIEFESPAVSLLGFEHKPSTQEHINAVEAAKVILKSSPTVFTMQGAKCSADTINVDILGPAGEVLEDKHDDHEHEAHSDKHDDHAHEAHSEDKHDDHEDEAHSEGDHDDHEHETHSKGKQDEHERNESHSEVSASYVYRCDNTEKLKSINVALFEHFSGLEKINVNWVTETQQGQVILRSASSIIKLK